MSNDLRGYCIKMLELTVSYAHPVQLPVLQLRSADSDCHLAGCYGSTGYIRWFTMPVIETATRIYRQIRLGVVKLLRRPV